MADAAVIALLRQLAPEFSDAGTFSDAMIAARLDGWASAVTGRRPAGTRYDLALAYAGAHRLTLDLRATGGTGSGSGSASVGAVSSASAGPLSLSFGGAATTRSTRSAPEADLMQTSYGLAWLGIMRTRAAAVPRQL